MHKTLHFAKNSSRIAPARGHVHEPVTVRDSGRAVANGDSPRYGTVTEEASPGRDPQGRARGDGGAVHRVVVVGGGFAGLRVVQGLRRAPVEVTLVDRQNYTLFQPLVYQVATGALSPAEIAVPLRSIFAGQRNASVVLGEVSGFDLERREVALGGLPNGADAAIPYDTLVVAGGSRYSYFGHDDWQTHAPELKSLAGALDIRSRILGAFEAAELEPDPARRRAWLTFVVVGAGPTGVEMAGRSPSWPTTRSVGTSAPPTRRRHASSSSRPPTASCRASPSRSPARPSAQSRSSASPRSRVTRSSA